ELREVGSELVEYEPHHGDLHVRGRLEGRPREGGRAAKRLVAALDRLAERLHLGGRERGLEHRVAALADLSHRGELVRRGLGNHREISRLAATLRSGSDRVKGRGIGNVVGIRDNGATVRRTIAELVADLIEPVLRARPSEEQWRLVGWDAEQGIQLSLA